MRWTNFVNNASQQKTTQIAKLEECSNVGQFHRVYFAYKSKHSEPKQKVNENKTKFFVIYLPDFLIHNKGLYR